MKPTRNELLLYTDKRKDAAKLYGVSEKTITRWMQKHGIFKPKHNFGPGKLNMEKAQEIRRAHKGGKTPNRNELLKHAFWMRSDRP